MRTQLARGFVLAAVLALVAACSNSGGSSAPATSATSAAPSAAGSAAGSPAGSAPASGGTIKIGGGFALTGDESALDLPAANGAKLAVKEINAAGGINGSQIDFIVHDSQYKMDVTAQTAKQFVEQDKVPLMIGYTDTDSVLASGPTFQSAGIPFITVGATSPKIPTQVGDMMFLACFGDNVQAAVGAEYSYETFGHNAYFLWDKGIEYTTLLGEYFKARFTELGGTIALEDSYADDATDFSAQITKIKADNADTLFLTTAVEQITLVMKQAQEQRLTRKVVTTGGSSSPTQLIKQAGAAAEGSYHIVFFMPWFPEAMPDGKLAKAFVDEWAKRGHPFEGLTEGFRGHDGIATIAEAIRVAGKDDPKAVQEALWKVSLMGVNGPIKFEKDGPAGKESGQSKPSIFVVQIRDGKVALPDFLAKK